MITLVFRNVLVVLTIINSFIGIRSVEVATTVPEKIESILKNANVTHLRQLLNNSRRIVIGTEALETRPYMVYLKLPTNNPKYKPYRRWLCGGVIIHEEYILTSAACIEDARNFYVVSGTHIHDEEADRYNNPCIKNGAKKAVWKCVPRNYAFDGHDNDNIRWMNNDIAVVKVEDEFDFYRRIRGCDYIPRPICYNNQTGKLEEEGTIATIAGWGSTLSYNEPSTLENRKRPLLETYVRLLSKVTCKKRWGKRYHNIIDNYMICSKDITPDLSELCSEKYVDCSDINYDDDSSESRRAYDPEKMILHSAYNHSAALRRDMSEHVSDSGGFCENDHGGPLVYGTGADSIVIGIISACLVKEGNNRCYGPFLYTSVYKNRILINCAVYKDISGSCDKLFRADGTHVEEEMSWVDHPDGPAKNELPKHAETNKTEELKMRRFDNSTGITKELTVEPPSVLNKILQHSGVVLRPQNGSASRNNTSTKSPQ